MGFGGHFNPVHPPILYLPSHQHGAHSELGPRGKEPLLSQAPGGLCRKPRESPGVSRFFDDTPLLVPVELPSPAPTGTMALGHVEMASRDYCRRTLCQHPCLALKTLAQNCWRCGRGSGAQGPQAGSRAAHGGSGSRDCGFWLFFMESLRAQEVGLPSSGAPPGVVTGKSQPRAHTSASERTRMVS